MILFWFRQVFNVMIFWFRPVFNVMLFWFRPVFIVMILFWFRPVFNVMIFWFRPVFIVMILFWFRPVFIVIVLFWFFSGLSKKDYKNKYLVTGDWSQCRKCCTMAHWCGARYSNFLDFFYPFMFHCSSLFVAIVTDFIRFYLSNTYSVEFRVTVLYTGHYTVAPYYITRSSFG